MTINDFTKSGTNASNECILDDPNLTSSGGYSYCGHCNETHWIDGTIGGGNNNSSQSYTYSANDTFANEQFSTASPTTQSHGATCVSANMGFIDQALGGDRDEAYYNNKFTEYTNGATIQGLNGLTPASVVEFARLEFDSKEVNKSISEYDRVINDGNVVMTHIEGHCVTVIGKTEDGNYIYMDAGGEDEQGGLMPGSYKQAPINTFGNEYSIDAGNHSNM